MLTPAQQSALETLAGRPLSPEEIVTIDNLLPDRNDVQIAAVIAAGQPPLPVSIKVEDVFDTLFSTGDYLTLKTAQMAGNPLAAMAFAVLADAKQIGPGVVNLQSPVTAGLLDNLQGAALLSQVGRDALDARSYIAGAAIHYNAVSDALNMAEGRLTLGA